MKLSEVKEDTYTFTGKLSDINRQIAFVGIAIIWIFKKANIDGSQVSICSELVLPAILLVAALALDVLQYAYQSTVWYIFYRKNEKRGIKADDDIVDAPIWMNRPTWSAFILKIFSVMVAYCFIIIYLFKVLLE